MLIQTDAAATDNSTIGRYHGAIDWDVLDALKILQKPGKPDICRKLMKIYIHSAPAQMEQAKAAVTAGDGQALMNATHALKSSSLSIGAVTFGTTCGELEQLGRANSLENAPALLARAETEFIAAYSAFLDALEQHI